MLTSRHGQWSGSGERSEDLTVCFAAREEREQTVQLNLSRYTKDTLFFVSRKQAVKVT